MTCSDYYNSPEQEFWEKPKPAKPDPKCEYCAPVYPNMLVRWPNGDVTRHLVKHYHWQQGRVTLEQKPIEGKSSCAKHTYPLVLENINGTFWRLKFGGLQVEIVAGDQEFDRA